MRQKLKDERTRRVQSYEFGRYFGLTFLQSLNIFLHNHQIWLPISFQFSPKKNLVPFFSFSKAKKFNRLCHFWVLWYFLSIEILDVSVYIIIGFDSHIYTCYIGQWCITQLYFSLFNFALSLWILSFFLQWLRLFSFSPWWCVALDKNLSLSRIFQSFTLTL